MYGLYAMYEGADSELAEDAMSYLDDTFSEEEDFGAEFEEWLDEVFLAGIEDDLSEMVTAEFDEED